MANARILAVDDSPTILEMIKAILVSGGYEVLTAVDGAEALETARAESPDLILLDVMLPKLDGYRVCRLLKFDKNYRSIPISISSPDLAAVSLTAPTNASSQQPITAFFSASNVGGVAAPAGWADRLYLSPDGIPGTNNLSLIHI